MEKEIWKDIEGFEKLYQVSNLGNIKSLIKNKLLNPIKLKNGYLYVNLYKNGIPKRYYIHRLVAETYIPNPDNLDQINHKNEIKTDNRVENLEWCTIKYNMNYGTLKKRMIETKTKQCGKKISQYDLRGNYIKTWDSIHEIERVLKIPHQNIIRCCKGKVKTAGNYIWKYNMWYQTLY